MIIHVHEDGLTVDVQFNQPGQGVVSGQGVVTGQSGPGRVGGDVPVPVPVPVNDQDYTIERHIPLHRLQIYIPPPVIIVLPPPPTDLEIVSNVLNIMVAQVAGEDPIAPLVDTTDALITSQLAANAKANANANANTISSNPPRQNTDSVAGVKGSSNGTSMMANGDNIGSPSPKGKKKKVALLVPNHSPSFLPEDGVSALEDGEGVSGAYSVLDISGLQSIAESTADLITPIKKTNNSSLTNSPMRRRSPSPSYIYRYASEKPVVLGDRVEARQNVLRLGNLSRWYWGKVVFCRLNGSYRITFPLYILFSLLMFSI